MCQTVRPIGGTRRSTLVYPFDADGAAPRSAGIHDVELKLASGRSARCTLSLPAPADGLRSPPLVLVLHYGGTPTRYYGRPLLEEVIEPAFRSTDAVYLAPESLAGAWASEDNEAFVMQLLEQAGATYAVDRRRVVVCGYSMGAIGTWHFVMHYPEYFSAAVPVAGFPNHALDTHVPVQAFHSAQDELFDLAKLREQVLSLRARGCAVELNEVEVRGHFDVHGYRRSLAAVPGWLTGIWGKP